MTATYSYLLFILLGIFLFCYLVATRSWIKADEKINNGKSIIETLTPLRDSSIKWGVLIGPEGGFSDLENELIAKTKNVVAVSLGDSVLRSDTAITVSLYCIQELLVN